MPETSRTTTRATNAPAAGRDLSGVVAGTTTTKAERAELERLARAINERFNGAQVARVTLDHVGEPLYIRAAAPVDHPGVLLEVRAEHTAADTSGQKGERCWVEAYAAHEWAVWGRPFASREVSSVDELVAAVASFVPPPDVYTHHHTTGHDLPGDRDVNHMQDSSTQAGSETAHTKSGEAADPVGGMRESTGVTAKTAEAPELPVIGLVTLQFSVGGLFDGRPVEDEVHLIRRTARGTPGPTLCGIDRFDPKAPGWCVGGGVTAPDLTPVPCPECRNVAVTEFPGLPIGDTLFRLDWTAPTAPAAPTMQPDKAPNRGKEPNP